jgi:hypothetical protein
MSLPRRAAGSPQPCDADVVARVALERTTAVEVAVVARGTDGDAAAEVG